MCSSKKDLSCLCPGCAFSVHGMAMWRCTCETSPCYASEVDAFDGCREFRRKCCGTCADHDAFSGVCANAFSDYRADFTDDDFCCKHWEPKPEPQ